MAPRFLDTNILIRLLTRDDEAKARRALALLMGIEQGEETVITSAMVVFEAVFVLEKRYAIKRTTIRYDLREILSLNGLRLENKNLYLSALDLYVQNNISFADAYNAAYMRSRGISEIYTWDSDFDKIEGIVRVEPGR